MILQLKNYRIISYLFTLVLFIGLACSSDDNTMDDDGILPGASSFSMKLDGELWKADETQIITIGGPEWWEEEDEEIYLVTISATKYLDNTNDPDNSEVFGITIVVPVDKFNDPKGIYNAPPPDAMNEVGYSWGNFISSTNTITYISIDPSDELRVVGNTRVTGFEIGSQFMFGEGYVGLAGTFEYELFGLDANSENIISIKATEGSFQIANQF